MFIFVINDVVLIMLWWFMAGVEVTLGVQYESSIEFFVEMTTCWSETIDGVAIAA